MKKHHTKQIAIATAFFLGAGIYLYGMSLPVGDTKVVSGESGSIIPDRVVVPVAWGNMGARLTTLGVIDEERMRELYDTRGGLTTIEEELFFGTIEGDLVITRGNAPAVLNALWAFGLANKNKILEEGEMSDPRYGGAGNFASTGGWTLSSGHPMEHYSMHELVMLSEREQALVDKVARGIYRPCCGNSTHFPDCNHGMAMLGLLELMASSGMNEREMYDIALKVNALWFPGTYETIALYLFEQGKDWRDVSSEILLGASYSSGQGFARIQSQIENKGNQNSGGCGA